MRKPLSNDLEIDVNEENSLYMDDYVQKNSARSLLQSIINNNIEHSGFYFKDYFEGNDISVYCIKSSDNSEETFRPKLIIKYYLHEKIRI